jgi:hypothetical protein
MEGVIMSDEFVGALSGEKEIMITLARRGGKKRTIPIWFVVDGRKMQLLPMYGLRTKWFQDVQREDSMTVEVKNHAMEFRPRVIRQQSTIDGIVSSFAAKYGEASRKYYATQDVALEVDL